MSLRYQKSIVDSVYSNQQLSNKYSLSSKDNYTNILIKVFVIIEFDITESYEIHNIFDLFIVDQLTITLNQNRYWQVPRIP